MTTIVNLPLYGMIARIEYDRNVLTLILFGIMVGFLTNLFLTNIILLFAEKSVFDIPFLEEYDLVTELILVLVAALIVETFIVQFLIINTILVFDFKYIQQFSILVSAVAFAAGHYYNLYYVGITFVLGIILAFFFVKGREKFKQGFLITACIHAGMNALSYIEF